VMATAGLYETSGDWLYDVGLPGKSGIGGGIVTVSPGKGGLGTYAPPLDQAGNSVKGQLAARFLSERLGLSLFASPPEGWARPAVCRWRRGEVEASKGKARSNFGCRSFKLGAGGLGIAGGNGANMYKI